MGPLDRQGHLSITGGADVDTAANAVNFSRGGIGMSPGFTYTFAVPLISGIIGTSLNKMLPIGNLIDLRVEISWESSAQAVYAPFTAASPSTNIWQVVGAELVLQVLSLNRDVHDSLVANKSEIMISTESYRNYNTVLNGGNTADNVVLPLKFTSTKSLVSTFRLQSNQNVYNVASVGSRRNPFATNGATTPSIQWLLGNVYAPAVPLRSVPEIYSEFGKTFHSLGSIHNKTCCNEQTYDRSIDGANNIAIIPAFATSAVITVATGTAGLIVGQPIVFTSVGTGGAALPIVNTIYYINAVLSPTTFNITSIQYSPANILTVVAVNTGGTPAAILPSLYNQTTPTFVLGLNTDTMYQASNNSMSGINTQAGNCFINMTYSAPTPTNGQRFDCWAHYDQLLIIDQQTKQMTIRV
jgi:hypothetical protein